MRPFKFNSASNVRDAVNAVSKNDSAKFIAGGTNLVDLMKEDVERPTELVDVSRIDLRQIRSEGDSIIIGAMAKNTETANHPLVKMNLPLLSQAIFAGASPQIRNMATNGGNLMQRTRCVYFYDTSMPCNKREKGSGCAAKEGLNRMHAIFGWSDECVAVHPSDMCVALAALDAVVRVEGPDGKEGKAREIGFADFHRLPADDPTRDNTLKHGELITAISIPKNRFARNSYYLKVRDRASYAFALVSVAAAAELDGKKINAVRIALGGVAHKPWRASKAESFLKGNEAVAENFEKAAALELEGAKPLGHNEYKVELAKRAIVRALQKAVR
ncbi:MAG: xanthine dehydrogenase family protein subunit M [Acidobacteria bacterium]|nr:MAG: xanthine dehydrogenase family protein subunit M [Acidobacteriota bacterium]REK02769.1 MAG: xanthine dehydrogenase family protein subunit M [Acidobacteriota bacterium]REK13426.1 MAG: xanthine dehydrogenase family protein subunit M [Acidobacteriota bacterium]REK41420.1 MAG: xanthine dehydrogenase family protein subunit M [Acidobacteriota bacterium]